MKFTVGYIFLLPTLPQKKQCQRGAIWDPSIGGI
jgi:hypothetical protein